MKQRGFLELVIYFSRNLLLVISIVLIWRGIWHLLDYFDLILFNGNTLPTSIVGIILGLILLYLPDRDLKEI
jgi:uncharacterized membrane protein HdeD (DUF308 family)